MPIRPPHPARRSPAARRPAAAVRAACIAAVAAAALGAGAAPAGALNVVDDDQAVIGRQCVGTACSRTGLPALELQVHDDDTPAMRLQQTGTVFGDYTWDVGGNEANFFVRDITGGGTLPFRIFPGAAGNALTVKPAGIGIGTDAPASALDLRRDGARISVRDTTAERGARVLAELVASGAPLLRFDDAAEGGQDWIVGAGSGGAFALRDGADGAPEAFLVTPAGTATARGVLQQSADPELRVDERPVDGGALLASLRALELNSWQTRGDASGGRHLGPSGATFRAAFGIGGSDATIAPADLAGVALVAAQQLAGESDALAGRADALARRLDAIEAALGAPPADGDLQRAVARLVGENAALRRRVAALERARRAQSRRLRSVAKRERATARRVARLGKAVDRLAGAR
ncbi:hypothetical protein [Conexibacter arvalis]|uniref:Peptidase S74 domain-containing protein n=1 Tax=Conexibacter arvalis TaxID=912552 RepID=A0A840IB92_9ACTN|nr:hypothetical protein [Conexibacter arvalis]MBB4661892.1 hypothetical protein [Conexibacter arvalis]